MISYKNLIKIYNSIKFIEDFYDDTFELFDLSECSKEVIMNILDAAEGDTKPAAQDTSAIEIIISSKLSLVITSNVDPYNDYSMDEFVEDAIAIEAPLNWEELISEAIENTDDFNIDKEVLKEFISIDKCFDNISYEFNLTLLNEEQRIKSITSILNKAKMYESYNSTDNLMTKVYVDGEVFMAIESSNIQKEQNPSIEDIASTATTIYVNDGTIDLINEFNKYRS